MTGQRGVRREISLAGKIEPAAKAMYEYRADSLKRANRDYTVISWDKAAVKIKREFLQLAKIALDTIQPEAEAKKS